MVKQKDRNILSQKNQEDLDHVTSLISASAYKPDQIFVESYFSQKNQLNAHYQLYLNNKYNLFTDTVKKCTDEKILQRRWDFSTGVSIG